MPPPSSAAAGPAAPLPGSCYRCWAPHDDLGLVPFGTPEILSSDLAPLALDLAAAGVADPLDLAWLDPPPAAAFTQARDLLTMLGALAADGRITPHGRRMASLPLHPRLAHLAIEARRLGQAALAADLAALLGDRDIATRTVAKAEPGIPKVLLQDESTSRTVPGWGHHKLRGDVQIIGLWKC